MTFNNPARLAKQTDKGLSDKALGWVLEHPTIAFIILFVLLAMMFGILFNIIYGMATIESGVMRNFMNNSL